VRTLLHRDLPGLVAEVTSMEEATRRNRGPMDLPVQRFIHSRTTVMSLSKDMWMYRAIDSYTFFNTSDAHALPVFDLMPESSHGATPAPAKPAPSS